MDLIKCLKVTKEGMVVANHRFTFHKDRITWLLVNGFVEQNGVWEHPFTHEIVGLFDLPDQRNSILSRIEKNCATPTKRTKGMWDAILRKPA